MRVELLIRSAVLPMAILTANILCLYIIWASIHDKIATFYYSKKSGAFFSNKLSSFLSFSTTPRRSEKDRRTLKNLSLLCSPWKNMGAVFCKEWGRLSWKASYPDGIKMGQLVKYVCRNRHTEHHIDKITFFFERKIIPVHFLAGMPVSTFFFLPVTFNTMILT